MARYLITGGCGFIGSHLAEALVAEGASEVILLDNLSSGKLTNIAAFREQITFIKADIRDRDALSSAFDGVDFVFHEAALVSVFDSVNRPDENHEINVTGTLNVLMAARAASVKRVVQASSAAIYGNNAASPKNEEMRPAPVSPYGAAKIMAEYQATVFSGLYDLPVVSLRYFNVYGPRQDPGSAYSGVISRFVDATASGRRPTIYGDGLQSRDFVYVADVVQANLLAMRSPAIRGGEAFNVATGRGTTLIGLLDGINRARGCSIEAIFEPARAGDIRDSLADISRIGAGLGFVPRFTLDEGLRRLLPG